ncbi:MAG: hypothetical protein ABI528_02670 [bacterium]
MKILKVVSIYIALIVLVILPFSSCNDDVLSPDVRQAFDFKAWDYSDSHYLLDTIYKSSFIDYSNNVNVTKQTQDLAVDDQSFEVWVQTDISTVGYRYAGLYIDLPSLPSNGKYHDSLKLVSNPQQGVSTFGVVRRLSKSEYRLNKYAGYVSLIIDVPDNYFAGIGYKRSLTGEQFGTISTDSNIAPTDTLVLKMIKVANLIPQNTLAWEMKLKNIYNLPFANVNSDGFELNIKYLGTSYLPIDNLNSTLLTIMGLDKYTNGRSGTPDNKFDFLNGYTIDAENGWIIFPDLKPFYSTLEAYSANGITIGPDYWYPEMYEQTKQEAKFSPNASKYNIEGLAGTLNQ